MEGYVNLFDNEHDGTNRPHFKGYIKIDGIDHEFALWPNKDGKKGYSGKYKPKASVAEKQNSMADAIKEQFPGASDLNDPVPF